MPLPCSEHAALQATSQGHGTARGGGTRHGMCEITSAVSRRPMGDLPRFGSVRRQRGFSRLAVRIFPPTRGLLRRTRHCRRTAVARHELCELALRLNVPPTQCICVSFATNSSYFSISVSFTFLMELQNPLYLYLEFNYTLTCNSNQHIRGKIKPAFTDNIKNAISTRTTAEKS